MAKQTIWLKYLGREIRLPTKAEGGGHHARPGDKKFEVMKTQNTLKPTIGETLDQTEIRGYLDNDYTVNIN